MALVFNHILIDTENENSKVFEIIIKNKVINVIIVFRNHSNLQVFKTCLLEVKVCTFHQNVPTYYSLKIVSS